LQKKLWKFLIGDGDAEEYLLRTSAEFRKNSSNDSDIFSFYLNPFVQTGLLVSECINLDMSLVNGKIKLSEKSGKLKDRYSAISYANYVISTFFDSELLREARDENPYDDVIAWTQFY
jgi:hypothetical protein